MDVIFKLLLFIIPIAVLVFAIRIVKSNHEKRKSEAESDNLNLRVQSALAKFPNFTDGDLNLLEQYRYKISDKDWFAMMANLSKVPEKQRVHLMQILIDRDALALKSYNRSAESGEKEIRNDTEKRIREGVKSLFKFKSSLIPKVNTHPYSAENFVWEQSDGHRYSVDKEFAESAWADAEMKRKYESQKELADYANDLYMKYNKKEIKQAQEDALKRAMVTKEERKSIIDAEAEKEKEIRKDIEKTRTEQEKKYRKWGVKA